MKHACGDISDPPEVLDRNRNATVLDSAVPQLSVVVSAPGPYGAIGSECNRMLVTGGYLYHVLQPAHGQECITVSRGAVAELAEFIQPSGHDRIRLPRHPAADSGGADAWRAELLLRSGWGRTRLGCRRYRTAPDRPEKFVTAKGHIVHQHLSRCQVHDPYIINNVLLPWRRTSRSDSAHS